MEEHYIVSKNEAPMHSSTGSRQDEVPEVRIGNQAGSHVISAQQNWKERAGDVFQSVECLPSTKEAQGFIFSSTSTGRCVMHTCNFRTWEMEAGRSGVQGYLLLHREFEASHAGLQDAVTGLEKWLRG